MHHAHRHAAQHQAVGCFQAQQAAANHDRVLVPGGGFNHGVGVGNVAVCDHAFQILAGNRQDDGVGAGADQQPVIGFLGAVVGMNDALDAVYLDDFFASVQRDVVVGVPVPAVEHDLVKGLFTRQHRAEQNPVVVGMRFSTKHGDVIQLRRNLDQLFQCAHARHAVANHDQF